MEVSVSEEFIKVYEQISRLQNDIAELGKDCYDALSVSCDDIADVPTKVSELDNDSKFITQEELDSITEDKEQNYLKKEGEEKKQQCDIPTTFEELHTKTMDESDSSDNVATTQFVHDAVHSGNEIAIAFAKKHVQDGDFATMDQVNTAIQNKIGPISKQDVNTEIDYEISSAVEDINTTINQISDTIDHLQIPSKTSDLDNDSGFITINDVPGDLVTSVNGQTGDVSIDIPTVPTNVSAFTNDAGYITDAGVTSVNGRTGSVSVQENVQADWSATSGIAQILHKPALKRVATTGDYNDLDNLPTIPTVPTNVSAFTNDAGYLTQHQDISHKLELDDLAAVAISGDYADIKNTPEIPTVPKNISAFVNNVGYITASSIPDVNNKYDKTGGNISGDVDIDGTLKLNIEDEDYDSAITMSATLDDNLGTILTLTGNADSTQYRTVLRNIATPNSNYDAANKKYVDDHILVPNYYLVELNIDGSVHLKASSLTYSTVSANLTNSTKADYLDVFWENGAGTNQFTRFYAKAVEIVEVNSGDIKFIGDIEYAGIQRRMVFTLDNNDVLTTTSITTSEIISNKKNSVVNNLSDDYYASTNAIYNEFQRKPVTIWETSSTGLLSSDQDIKENMTWQLTGLDMSPYKRVKIYTKAGKKTSGVGQDASNTPSVVLEMSLDSRAAGPTGGHFMGSIVGQKPNDANRLFTVTCAISADKTSFAVLRMSTLYGTAATANSDCNGYVFKIEGYYD